MYYRHLTAISRTSFSVCSDEIRLIYIALLLTLSGLSPTCTTVPITTAVIETSVSDQASSHWLHTHIFSRSEKKATRHSSSGWTANKYFCYMLLLLQACWADLGCVLCVLNVVEKIVVPRISSLRYMT